MSKVNSLYIREKARGLVTKNKSVFYWDRINAKYEAKGKTSTLQEEFKSPRLSDEPSGKHFLGVAYALEKRKPMIIKSGDHPDLLSSQVADASSAAPTCFPNT